LQQQKTHTNSYLIKQLPNAIVFLNKKMEIAYVSDKLFTEFNLTSSESNAIGRDFFKIFPYLSLECQNAIKNSITGENYKAKREYCYNNDENYKWLQWTSTPWYDENENIIGVIVKLENIDETTSTELKLKKTEKLLEETTVTGKIGTWEYNINDNHLEWSSITKKIHEVPNDYSPNIEDAIVFFKEGKNRNTIIKVIQKSLKNVKPWSKKLKIITAKNKEKWVIASSNPILKNGDLIGFFGTLNDVTDFAKSEIKIKEEQQLLRTLIDHLPLCVFVKDLESRKVIANKYDVTSCNLKTEEELIGKDDFDIFKKEVAESMRAEDYGVMSTGIPLIAKENVMIRKNGVANTVLTSKIALKDNNGKIKGLVGFSLDITDIKNKEKELRKLINVTSLQNERLINFAHIISHNLRSQTANFSMLLDFLVKETNEIEKKSITNMLISTSDKLLETLNTLNEVVIINTNVTLEKKPICLSNKILNIEKELFPLLNSNKAVIINNVSKSVYINVTENYLNDILKNMITNSIKYKHPERDPMITLSAEKNEEYTILSIEDNGIGIDLKKYGHKIFGMHKTFHTENNTKGISLYIIKNQIEAMNGKITVSSKVGKGSIFNIYFNEKN